MFVDDTYDKVSCDVNGAVASSAGSMGLGTSSVLGLLLTRILGTFTLLKIDGQISLHFLRLIWYSVAEKPALTVWSADFLQKAGNGNRRQGLEALAIWG